MKKPFYCKYKKTTCLKSKKWMGMGYFETLFSALKLKV